MTTAAGVAADRTCADCGRTCGKPLREVMVAPWLPRPAAYARLCHDCRPKRRTYGEIYARPEFLADDEPSVPAGVYLMGERDYR